jgi:hypothetical protein
MAGLGLPGTLVGPILAGIPAMFGNGLQGISRLPRTDMIPRTRAESSAEAEATIASLRRYHEKRRLSWGPIIAALAIGWTGTILFMSRTKNADPLADARLNNAPAVAAATPSATVPRAQLVYQFAPRPIGDAERVALPDGRILWTKVCARVKSLTDLPLSGNQIGDMRYVSGTNAFWVWTTPISGGLPTWIDP